MTAAALLIPGPAAGQVDHSAPTPVGPFGHKNDVLLAAARDRRLRGQEVAKDVLDVIVGRADSTTGRCFMTDATIAKDIGCHVGSVRRAVARLASLGYLPVVERGAYRGKATYYGIPLEREPAGKPSAGATLPDEKAQRRRTESLAPAHGKPSAGATPTRSEPREEPLQRPDSGGIPSPDMGEGTGRPAMPEPPAEGANVESWGAYALAVADAKGCKSAATNRAVDRAGAAIGRRLRPEKPGAIHKRLWDAVRAPHGSRERRWFGEATRAADTALGFALGAGEALKQFLARCEGKAIPWPVPADAPAAAARAAEDAGRPRPRSDRPAAEGSPGALLARVGELLGEPSPDAPPPGEPSADSPPSWPPRPRGPACPNKDTPESALAKLRNRRSGGAPPPN